MIRCAKRKKKSPITIYVIEFQTILNHIQNSCNTVFLENKIKTVDNIIFPL